MAANRAGHTTGAVQDGHDLRRRNVPVSDKSNGSLVRHPDIADEKKSQQVRPVFFLEPEQLGFCPLGGFFADFACDSATAVHSFDPR